MKFYFFSLGVTGSGISGGDRIFIEFAKRWGKNYSLDIFTSNEGERLCKRLEVNAKNLRILKIKNQNLENNFVLNYVYKIITGIKLGLSLKIENSKEHILYSASDFWMDVLPAFILKIRYPKTYWAAAWYQTAPNPFIGYSEGSRMERYRYSAFIYWLSQLIIKPLISKFANYVLVNNEEEKHQFPRLNFEKKAIVVYGAVDLEKIGKWKSENGKLPKVYDAVFQGRFHPQKGVAELVEIWKQVVETKPKAILAMIGDGPLMESVNMKIRNLKLEKNIRLLGYLFDGSEKYRIFCQSKVVLHPAFFDSGGMAAAEAMAFDLPCIGFDLPSYKSYYPKGMIKVKIGDLAAFSEKILKYLNNDRIRIRDGIIARKFIENKFSWETRSEEILNKLIWE